MQYIKDAKRKIAYFSMEIGLNQAIRTYSGGLGILAGDTIRSAADLGVPMVAVTLLYRKGYLHQKIDEEGRQIEQPDAWEPRKVLKELPNRISLRIEGRHVYIRAWVYDVEGIGGFKIPVFFLDADLPENDQNDRGLTHHLYGGDEFYRLGQEKILGIGGVRMLRNLGYSDIERYHMNEGHAALLTLELLDITATNRGRDKFTRDDIEAVRDRCVFTTHTPVAAGHDKFSLDMVRRVLGRKDFEEMKDVLCENGMLNMTFLAMTLSRYVNGVAKKHGEVSRRMFENFTIDSITNGVHAATWISDPLKLLFDKHIPEWRKDNYTLRYVFNITLKEIQKAHGESKKKLLEFVLKHGGKGWKPEAFTIGSARRATGYKRGDLLFHDPERLSKIAEKQGDIQVVYAGKAHPRDQGGKDIIRRIFQMSKKLDGKVRIIYLEDYDIDLAKTIIPGVDLWLNTPEPPLEASGTSGMKAAMNGVPSLSILDGWWIEGHVEGITGWSIGKPHHQGQERRSTVEDAEALYEILEKSILPLYYMEPEKFRRVMRNAIALNGSFFNTHRMVQEYTLKAYYL
jgi:glycogen phosphorylase